MYKQYILLFTLILLTSLQGWSSELRLANCFSNNMVLQRNTEVTIWGWANVGQSVVLSSSWCKDTVSVKANGDGKWTAKYRTNEQLGPQSLSVSSSDKSIILKNVLLGEVWLCSGQSNMQWSAQNNVKQMKAELPNIENMNIRILQVPRVSADHPQDDIHTSWENCTAETMNDFSVIGYFFAKKLCNELKVPIGIINSSWSGTSAELWTPKEVVESDSGFYKHAASLRPNNYTPHRAGSIWNGMLHPISKFRIAGVIWYQGESNVSDYANYDNLINNMVNSWRSYWQKEFPFYFVQIAPFGYGKEKPVGALLREQQSKTALSLKNSGMVVTTDLVDDIKDIHPQMKKEVADRLSLLALSKKYNRNLKGALSPVMKDYNIVNNEIQIAFHDLDEPLVVIGDTIQHLYIAGDDRIFVPAKYKIKKNMLIVYHDKIRKPKAVRFGFSDTAMPNLFNKRMLPVAPFRTDNW